MTETNLTPPVLSGTAKQNQILSTSDGTWDSDLADFYFTYAYRWLRCDAAGANCVAIPGATDRSYTLTAADVGHRLESEVTATEHAITPPPPSSATHQHFTDFFYTYGYSSTFPNGQIFHNRWKTTNLQTLGATQTPWPSTGGAAIYEVSTAQGAGFRFLCNPEHLAQSGGKKTEMLDGQGNPHSPGAIAGAVNTITDNTFYVEFPSAGNPTGFPGSYDTSCIFLQHSMDAATRLHLFGINMSGGARRFFLSIGRNSPSATERQRYSPAWQVQFDTPYKFRYRVSWKSDGTGTFQWWIDDVLIGSYTGITYESTPNTEMGFYSADTSKNNEVIISGMTVAHV